MRTLLPIFSVNREEAKDKMEAERNSLKVLGFDFFVDVINIIIIISSYILTITILDDAASLNVNENFLRGAFVFIAPCAMEGIQILTSKGKTDKTQDGVEVILSLVSMVTTLALAMVLIFNNNEYVILFRWLIMAYPLKIFSDSICDLLHLLKERKK